MELLARFKERSPEYAAEHHDMVLSFTLKQGGQVGTRAKGETYSEGRFFSTVYEMYMYAALLGLKRNLQIPIPRGTEKKKFIEIKSWHPSEVADYIVMALLAKTDLDFNALENMEEKEVEDKLTELRSLLESYTNGGLDIIRAKREEDPTFFQQNDNCFLDLLET